MTSVDISTIKLWFERAVPTPTDKNRAVQIGVHYEESSEMLDATTDSREAEELHSLARRYKSGREIVVVRDKQELLDSLCDQIVTAIGVAHMFGFDITGALNEVNRSNWSKFLADGTPLFDENGKVAKNPLTYSKPDLSAFV